MIVAGPPRAVVLECNRRSTAWHDLPHADSLRAANAAYEARR